MKKILVYRHGGIGDTVLISPTLQALHRRFPGAEITFVGHPGRIFLLDGPPNADHTISSEISLWQNLYGETVAGLEGIRSFLRSFDQVIVYGLSTGERIRRIGLADDQVCLWPAIPPPEWLSHATLFYLKAISDEREIGCDVPKPVISSSIPKSLAPVVGGGERNSIVIHPGAGSPAKRCDLSFYLRIADWVTRSLALEVTFMLGPAEAEIGWDLEISNAKYPVTVISDLRSATTWLCKNTCFMGNDSGMTHMAAALGIPTVVFFRGSDPRVWAPMGDRVLVCDTRQDIPFDTLLSVLLEFLVS